MRLADDFNKSRQDVIDYIKKYIPDVTDEMIDAWTASGKLENMVIDGETRYFHNAARNLFRIDPECNDIWNAGSEPSMKPDFVSSKAVANMVEIINDIHSNGGHLAQPDEMRVKYTLTVDADVVPEGETIRCWLPFPRTDIGRQQDVKFISSKPENGEFSDPESYHSTLYLEQIAVAGQPTVFQEEFTFTSYGEWYQITPDMVKEYDKSTELYKTYTSEKAPHIVFSDRMRKLSDSLTAGIDNPYEKALAIFVWIHDNIPWASAREYSTIECIPEYVLDNGHGDCGQVTLLFQTLARIAGIPTRWESGFSMIPGNEGLHDWSEIYFEGIGWVPMDTSRGITDYAAVRTFPLTTAEGVVSPAKYEPDFEFADADWAKMNNEVLYFQFGGIDSYRMILNNDYGGALSPAKKYPRSEPVDFQRGEVEWAGGNLYFNQWDYDIEVEHK